MTECLAVLSAEKYFESAKEMLEKRDLVGFAENITSAKLLAQEDGDLFAQVLFLRAKGLYLFRNFERAFDAINEALEYNDGTEKIRLEKYKGLIFGYHGRLNDAISLFKELLGQTDDITLLVELYINIVWANLSLYRIEEDKCCLEEGKKYLDLANEYFDHINNVKKTQICNNYGDYYLLNNNYKKAIEINEKALEYCKPSELPKVYNNLAELHLLQGNFEKIEELLHNAEVIANKYNNKFEVAKALYTKGIVEMQNEDWLKAADAFYVALDNFIEAEAFTFAFRCFTHLLDISKQFKLDCINTLREGMKNSFKNTVFFDQI